MDRNRIEVLGELASNTGKIHQRGRVYSSLGGAVMCTITSTTYKEPPKILVSCKLEDEDGRKCE